MTNKLENIEKQSTNALRIKYLVLSLIILCTACFLAYYSPLVQAQFGLFERQASTNTMASASDDSWKTAQTIYEFKAKDIDGNLVDFSQYK